MSDSGDQKWTLSKEQKERVLPEAKRHLDMPEVKQAAELWERVRAAKLEQPDPKPIKIPGIH